MLADVYRSRLGLLATPPVPAVVRCAASAGSGATRLIEQVAPVVAATLDGMPVPLIADGASTTVLLPLVDPAGVAMVFSALRAECSPAHVTRREMSIGTLTALGPLTGRLTPGPTEMG